MFIRDLRQGRGITSHGFVDGLCSAEGVSLAAQFATRRGRACALFARSWFGFREFLALAGETGMSHFGASAASAFRATLAAVGLSFVGVSFARPLVLNHAATGARRMWGGSV